MPRPKSTPEERRAKNNAKRRRYYYRHLEKNREKARLAYHEAGGNRVRAERIAAMTPEELAAFRAWENAKSEKWKRNNPAKRKESQRKSNARWRTKNRPQILRAMHEAHKARMAAMTPEEKTAYLAKKAEQSRASRAANPEKHNRYRRAYYARHRAQEIAKAIETNDRRRARLRGAAFNDLTSTQRQMILDAAHGVCCYCPFYKPGCKACRRHSHKLTIDHITAIVHGGNNTLHNLVACCLSCNSKKRTRPNPVPVQPLLI